MFQLGGKYFKKTGRLHNSPPKGKLLLSTAALMGGVVSSVRYISTTFVFLRPQTVSGILGSPLSEHPVKQYLMAAKSHSMPKLNT